VTIQHAGWMKMYRIGRRIAGIGLLAGLIVLLPGWFTGQSVGAQQTNPDALRALAVRFIAPPVAGPNGQAQSATLSPGALPADLPVMVPVPPGANLVGSVTRTFGGMSVSWEIAYDASGSADDLTKYYTTQLSGQGWTAPPARGVAAHGFAPATQISPPTGTFCRGSDGPYLAVNVIPTAGGPADLRVFVSAASGGICNGMTAMSGAPGPLDRLPALTAPAGVAITNPTGSVGTGKAVSEGVATTSATAVDLEAAYETQLTAAGWQKTGGTSASPFSWSTWTLPGDGNYQGYLSVLEVAGSNVRDLHLTVTSAGAAAQS